MINWDETRAKAAELLKRVGLPENPDTKIMDIGVGKQQLVEIAKALSKNVKLLILDEPTAALNDEDSAHLLDLVRQLRDEQGVTSIISHKLNEIAAIADNVTIIHDGATVGTMFVTPETPLDQDELIRKMVGRSLTNLYPEHEPNEPGEEYLRSRTGPCTTRSTRTGSWWTTPTSTYIPVRLWALRGSWAPGAPRWR